MDAAFYTKTLHGCRVLIVEDQFLMAEEMSASIRRLGGEVVGPVADTSGAMSLISQTAVDLAILDIDLDCEQVYVVADEMRRRGLPFIFATGYEPWVVPAHLRNAPHLEKPVSPLSLSELISRLSLTCEGSPS